MTLTIALLAVVLTGCFAPTAEEKKANQEFVDNLTHFADRLTGFAVDVNVLNSGVGDVMFCSASFYHKNERWPTNYAELSAFVDHSDGYLILSDHQYIQLKPLPNDRLQVSYVRPGFTNELKFVLGDPATTNANSALVVQPH